MCLFLCGISFACIANAQRNEIYNFQIKGNFIGTNTSKFILFYLDKFNKVIHDTESIVNGEFRFSGIIGGPVSSSISAYTEAKKIDVKNFVILFLEPGKMTVTLQENHFGDCVLTGSKTQKVFDSLNSKKHLVLIHQASIYYQTLAIKDSLRKINSKNPQNNLIDSLNTIQDSLFKQETNIELEFIRSVPYSIVAPFILENHLTDLPLKRLKEIYESWTPKIKACRYAIYISNELKKMSLSALSKSAPDFTATTINGEKIRLSSFHNKKVVLLDFWASWCTPCRASFIDLKKIVENDQKENFVVIAIAIQTKKDAWIKAIDKDKTQDWIHILTTPGINGKKGINSIVLKKYKSEPIPIQYLIDKDGKIVGNWVGESKENEKELTDKLKELIAH